MAGRWRRGSITRRVTATAAVVSAFGLTVVLGGLYLVVEQQLAVSIDDELAVRTVAVIGVLQADGLEALDLEPYVELHDGGAVTRSTLLRRNGQQLLPPGRLPTTGQQLRTTDVRLSEALCCRAGRLGPPRAPSPPPRRVRLRRAVRAATAASCCKDSCALPDRTRAGR